MRLDILTVSIECKTRQWLAQQIVRLPQTGSVRERIEPRQPFRFAANIGYVTAPR